MTSLASIESLAVRLVSMLSPPAAAGAVPVAAGFAAAAVVGAGGCCSPASARSRSIRGSTSLPSTTRVGFSVTDSEPEPLSPARASLKSLAANLVCDTSMPPSKLNLLASSGGSAGTGCPDRLTNVAMKPVSDSAETDATPARLALGPSSLSVPLKVSLPPPASSATLAGRPLLPLAPTLRSILSGAPLTVARPSSP
jgi:hypothetical protein